VKLLILREIYPVVSGEYQV